jgi:hypothetical protein
MSIMTNTIIIIIIIIIIINEVQERPHSHLGYLGL